MDTRDITISRRNAIAGAGVVAAATLTACSTYGKDSGGGDAAATPAPVESAPADGTAPADAIAATSDIPVGSGKIFDDIVITQPVEGDFRGLSPVCPHQGCKVATVTAGEIVCPCHGSTFSLDGAVTNGPARTGLEAIAIKVQGDSIVAG